MEAVAKLVNCKGSPRKMRLVVDTIRGKEVEKALGILKFTAKKSSINLEKLLLSAVANWQAKNEDTRAEDSQLFVKTAFVDGGRIMKRWLPAPQGRAYRLRKRSNHVTIVVDSKANSIQEEQVKSEAKAAKKITTAEKATKKTTTTTTKKKETKS